MITLEDINRIAAHLFLEVYGIDEDDNATLEPMCNFARDNWTKWFFAHRGYEVLRIDAVELAGNLSFPVLRAYIAINKEDLNHD